VVGTRVTAAMCARGRSVGDPRLSPDGSLVAFVATAAARSALVVAPATGGPELVVTADPVRSARPDGSGVFDWMPGGDGFVLIGTDGMVYHQPLTGGPPRRLADTAPAAAPAVSPDGTQVAYTVADHHVAVSSLDPAGPWPQRRSAQPDFCLDPSWSPDGALVAWHEWDVPAMPWDTSRIALGAASGAPATVSTPAGSAVAQPRVSPDGSRIGFLCDATGWLNLWVAEVDGSGARVLVDEPFEHATPAWGPGQRSWTWSPDGRQVAFCRNTDGFGQLCVADSARGTVDELDRGWWWCLSWRADRLAGVRSGARTPDQVSVWCLDAIPARHPVARGPVAGFEAAGLVEPELVTWPAEDLAPGASGAGWPGGVGATVHGRLWRRATGAPAADDARPAPLLVWVHGGPTGQHLVSFTSRVAFFSDRGWNILHVDPRGSSGHGRSYAQALRGRWGDLDVDDIAAGIRAAIARGWGDPDRVAVMGASSGGFAALGVLVRHPSLCAAGVDLYGVTDLFALAQTTHRYEAHYTDTLVGPLPGAADRYSARSPITSATAIAAPLLVLQGGADVVVAKSQSDALVDAVRRRGGTVEYHVYEAEGHGWSRPEVVIDELERIDAFLTRYVLRRMM